MKFFFGGNFYIFLAGNVSSASVLDGKGRGKTTSTEYLKSNVISKILFAIGGCCLNIEYGNKKRWKEKQEKFWNNNPFNDLKKSKNSIHWFNLRCYSDIAKSKLKPKKYDKRDATAVTKDRKQKKLQKKQKAIKTIR